MRAYWNKLPDAPARRRALALARRPWCHPPPGHPEAGPIPSPEPGAVVLLTFNKGSTRGAVWEISTRHADPGPERATLIGQALAAHRDAHRRASALLPMILPPAASAVATTAFPIRDEDGQVVLDGRSVGLPLLFASLSARIDVPVPATVAATGAIGPEGQIETVGGLAAKIEALYEGCPAVTRLLLPAAKLAEAQALVGPWTDDPHFELVGVATLQEAIDILWPDLPALCRARVQADVARSSAALGRYIRLREGTSWPAAARTADFLATLPGADVPALDRLARIARRHCGERDVLLPWPDPASATHREVWYLDAAHAVQSAGDSGKADELREYLRLAERELRPLGERSPGELELVGAIGRGWAVLHEPGRAEAHLREATEAWHLIGQPTRSSFPLCAWIRVAGAFALQGADAVIALAERWLADVPFDPGSQAYLRLELARARLSLDLPADLARRDADLARRDADLARRDADAVLAWAARPDGNPARSPGPTARRLRIRALRRLGKHDCADAELQGLIELQRQVPPTGPASADPSLGAAIWLARMDRLVELGEPLDGTAAHQAVEGLREVWAIEVDNVVRGIGEEKARDVAEVVRGLVRGFRY